MTEQDVLNLLDNLDGQVKESVTIIEDEKPSAYTAISNLRNDINNPPKMSSSKSNDKKEDIASLVECLTAVTDNFKNFTSNDPIKITQGVLGIIGAVGCVVAGPYGPLVAAGCGLISSVLSLFGGGGPSLTEQLAEIINQALEDFKDQEIYEQVIHGIIDMRALIAELMGVARYNGGIMKDTEKSFLTDAKISLVANDILAVLQGQLDRYKATNDDTKSQSLAVYTYYYAKICVYKNVLLNIHICLLRRNEMDSVSAGISAYLYQELPSQGKGVIGFLSTLPDPNGVFYWRLYRYVHMNLDVIQRMVLSKYRALINLEPMPGALCCLYNKATNGYSYSPGTTWGTDQRYFFRWGPGNAAYDALFRIVDAPNGNYYIYNVWFGEYVYASETGYDSDRRYVSSCTRGCVSEVEEASWTIEGDWADDCTFRNEKYLEYLYSSGAKYETDRYHNFTWMEGNCDGDAHWQIKECAYETTLNLRTPME